MHPGLYAVYTSVISQVHSVLNLQLSGDVLAGRALIELCRAPGR